MLNEFQWENLLTNYCVPQGQCYLGMGLIFVHIFPQRSSSLTAAVLRIDDHLPPLVHPWAR